MPASLQKISDNRKSILRKLLCLAHPPLEQMLVMANATISRRFN